MPCAGPRTSFERTSGRILEKETDIMNVQFQPDFRTAERRLPFECVALVLQGGGALGAYQAGVYEALVEAKIIPDWVAGVSIGAINAAIIAGNEPAERVAKLRAFWEEITANPLLDSFAALDALTPKGHLPRALFNQLSAASALVAGAAGFFSLRQPPPWLHPDGALEATSFYETSLLKSTLERLVDFDRINGREMRFSAGAVNVRTGNFVYFDNETHTIRAEHVMASGSLPPGFSSGGDRGRVLLGWRPRLEHTAAMGRREWPAAGYARLSGRSLERARRAFG
jgi:NTE family protein